MRCHGAAEERVRLRQQRGRHALSGPEALQAISTTPDFPFKDT